MLGFTWATLVCVQRSTTWTTLMSGVNYLFRSTTTINPDSVGTAFSPPAAEMVLLLAGPERSPEGAERRPCQQPRTPLSAPSVDFAACLRRVPVFFFLLPPRAG